MSCENSLEVYTTFEGQTLELLPINDFCIKYSKLIRISDLDSDSHLKCGEYLTSLSYLNSVCNYNRISVLDFETYRSLDILAGLLTPFSKKDYLNKKTLKSITVIVKYLMTLEKQTVEIIKSMSYRYIRLFLSLMWRNDYTHASIVARFLLDQMFIGNGIDKAVGYKIKEVKKAEKRATSMFNEENLDDSDLEVPFRNSESDDDKLIRMRSKKKAQVKESNAIDENRDTSLLNELIDASSEKVDVSKSRPEKETIKRDKPASKKDNTNLEEEPDNLRSSSSFNKESTSDGIIEETLSQRRKREKRERMREISNKNKK